jgi:RNA polymerase sigma factor (sigma-70 family)
MNTKNLSELTDQQLVQLYLKGNVEALSAFIVKNKTKIYTSIYLLVKDKYVAEDIFQDVFIKVIDTLKEGKYSDEGKFLPWVMRIAHNMSVDHFRKAKRMPIIRTNEGEDIFEALNFMEPSVDRGMISRQTAQSVRSMIDALPEDLREVIILRNYAELSFKEIAEITNCSINTALGRMRYALLNLRKMAEQRHVSL